MMKQRRLIATVLVACSILLSCDKRNAKPKLAMQVRFDNLTQMAERPLRAAAAREFLWGHWQSRQPATLLVTYVSKEGKQTDSRFDINLTGSTLLLHVSDTRYRYGYNGQVFKHEEPRPDVYTVDRVVPSTPCPSDANTKVEVVASNAKLTGSDYCLRFTGWGGEVEGSF